MVQVVYVSVVYVEDEVDLDYETDTEIETILVDALFRALFTVFRICPAWLLVSKRICCTLVFQI